VDKPLVRTTASNHALDVYVKLARRMTLTGIDQLWIADTTYIRLKAEFVYLALVLDGFSRKVVGWKHRHQKHFGNQKVHI
jgi:putative transposase